MATDFTRPFGITVIVVLQVLGGILGLGGGLLVLGISSMMRFSEVEIILFALSILFTAIGAAQLILCYGLWNGRGWAWSWTLIFAIIAVTFSLIGLAGGHIWNVVRLIGDGLVIYYLNTPEVKTFFHNTSVSATPTASP